MTTEIAARPKPAISPLEPNELLKLLASAVSTHPMNNLGGIDRIEERPGAEIDQLSVSGTVFAVLADRLEVLGVPTDQTVGGVMEALGHPRGAASAHHYAHEIGCTCHGPFISPDIASQRILNMVDKPAW